MWEAEILFGIVIVAWLVYETYGTWLQSSVYYMRIIGGLIVILILYWQTKSPEALKDTLEFAKYLMLPSTSGRYESREKRKVTNLQKKRVAADQSWKCGICTKIMDESYEVDHKLALYRGGTNDISNLIALCRNCHGKKTMTERLETN